MQRVRWQLPHLQRRQLDRLSELRQCNATLFAEPELLATLPPDELLVYFGKCWVGTWRSFLTNALPYVCVRAWLAAGFKPHQLLLLRSEQLRTATADEFLTLVANHTGLHYNRAVLHDKQEELLVHCEAADSKANRAAQTKHNRSADMVNTHGSYTGRNASSRTQLSDGVYRQFVRLAAAHERILEGLGVREGRLGL